MLLINGFDDPDLPTDNLEIVEVIVQLLTDLSHDNRQASLLIQLLGCCAIGASLSGHGSISDPLRCRDLRGRRRE